MGLLDGSVVNSTCCSFRGPWFESQHLLGSSLPSVTPVKGNPASSSYLYGYLASSHLVPRHVGIPPICLKQANKQMKTCAWWNTNRRLLSHIQKQNNRREIFGFFLLDKRFAFSGCKAETFSLSWGFWQAQETIVKRLCSQYLCRGQHQAISVMFWIQLFKTWFSVSFPTEYLGCSHTPKTERLCTLGSLFHIGLCMPIVLQTQLFIIFLVVSFQCFFVKPLLKGGASRAALKQFWSRYRT